MQQSRQSAADLVSPSLAYICEPDACRTALKWDHTPRWQIRVAQLDHSVAVRENILTGIHFLGCTGKCCGTYDRRNQVAQVTFAFFKCEMKFSGSTSSFDGNFGSVGNSAKGGKGKHTDEQVWPGGGGGWGAFCPKSVTFDVSIALESESNCSQPLWSRCRCMWRVRVLSHPGGDAGTRSAEKTKPDKYKLLCQQRDMDFVPIVFTTSGGMGEQSSDSDSTGIHTGLLGWQRRMKR